MTREMKSCPYCGGTNTTVVSDEQGHVSRYWYVVCHAQQRGRGQRRTTVRLSGGTCVVAKMRKEAAIAPLLMPL